MGRHAAPVAFDTALEADARWSPTNPVTDPLLLDHRLTSAPPASRPSGGAATPSVLERKPAAVTTPPRDRVPQPRIGHAASAVVAEHDRAMHPRPVAPHAPAPLRAQAHADLRGGFSDGPILLAPRVVAASLSTTRTPAAPVTADPAEALPKSFGRGRTASLAVCALAVLGAVTAAAAILPDAQAQARTDAAGKTCAAPATQPMPTASTTGRSSRAGHHHRSARTAAALLEAAAATPTAPAVSAAASAASVSTTATSTASATASSTTSDAAPQASPSPAGSSEAPVASASPSPQPTSSESGSSAPSGVVSALADALSGVAAGASSSLASGTFTFSNFSSANVGVLLPGGISGAGESKTVLQMTPHTSSKAGLVPTASGTTNPLSLLKVQSGSPVLRDFTLQGTPQGHLYNGLQIKGTSGAQVKNVRVVAVPGSDRVNPGETFGINDFHTTGSVYSGVEVDGAGVGASALAFNSSANPTVSDSYFHDNPYSAGLALWQTNNATLTDVISKNNRTGINLERTSGTINVVRPTLQNNSAQDFYIGSDQSSVRLNIVDPTFSGKIRIRIPSNYWAGSQQQQRGDVHVIINGVDKTDSVVQWV